MAKDKIEEASKSFIDSYFGNTQEDQETENTSTEETTVEETTEENTDTESEQTTQDTTDTTAEEGDLYFSEFFTEEESASEESTQDTVHEPQVIKDKVKYNLKDYVDNHSEVLDKYFRLKNLNVDSMSNEDLAKYKLKQENPSWTKEDIEDELKVQYGIGLKLKKLPEDALDSEIEEVERYNERIQEEIKRGERRLRSDVHSVKSKIVEEQSNLILPEVELDVELTSDPTQIITAYQEKAIQEQTKFLEEVWKPSIKEAVSKSGGFKQKIEFEVKEGDKVVSELTYKYTEKQKEELNSYLSQYQYHPTDDKYIINKETGEVDFQRFVNDKAKQLFAEDIIKASTKTALSQFKSKFVKEDMVNFSDEPRRVTKPNEQRSEVFNIWEESAKYHQRR